MRQVTASGTPSRTAASGGAAANGAERIADAPSAAGCPVVIIGAEHEDFRKLRGGASKAAFAVDERIASGRVGRIRIAAAANLAA